MKKDKDKDKDKTKEISNIDFIYQQKTVTIPYSGNEKLKDIFQSFLNEINKKKNEENKYIINEFAFLYESKNLEDDSKVIKEIIVQNKKNIIAERKLRTIKCPQCVCNDSIINLNNYQIAFYGCKYKKHINNIYLFDEYFDSQKVNYSKIKCSISGCNTTMNDCESYDDFYKCLTCTDEVESTQYLCSKHKEEHDKTHKQVRYDNKNYICEKHFEKFIKYCFLCNKNLCKDCSKEHKGKNHMVQSYESLAPKLDDIKKDLNIIKEKISKLEIFINKIKESLDGAYKIYEDYYKIANDITEKYELFNKDLKNYKNLRNLLNLKISNKNIIKDLEEIVSTKDLVIKSNKLISIYKEDREKYNNRTQALNLEKHGMDDYNEWKEENAIIEINKNNTSKNK